MSIKSLLLVAGLGLSTTVAFAADDTPDKGRKLLPRLFESTAATAAEATVRITSGTKDIVLGTVVSKDGYILTKGSEILLKPNTPKPSLTAQLRDGSTFDIEIKGYHNSTDLMLLKVDAEALRPIEFVPSKSTEEGDWVAITGVKSNAKNGEPDSIEAIQVGVLSASNRRLYGQEASVENGNRGYLGIVFEISGDLKNTRIDEVKNDGARRAGLKKGDAIVGVDTMSVENREDLFKFMNDTKPGQSIQVKVKRKDAKAGDEEMLTFKFNTIHSALMDRGTMQNTMGGSLSDRRTGFPKVIQHDTRLAPRECGGPLVDLEGRVIGLNIARAGRVETWALPADTIKAALKELQDGKHPFPKPAEVAKTKVEPKDTKDVKAETKDK